MKKLFVLMVAACMGSAHADEEFLGLYMSGGKIGYSSYSTHPDTLNKQVVTRSDSKTIMNAGLLGTAMSMNIEGSTWLDKTGHPLRMLFTISSAGRSQKVVAVFNSKTAEVDINNSGRVTHQSVTIPKGAEIVDDPLELMVHGNATPGAKRTIYVLDPLTVSLLKTDVVLVGPRSTTIKGQSVQGTLIQVIDPRLTTDVYVNAKGDLIKAEAFGIEMIPESREEALANDTTGYKPSADLAFTTSIHTDKPITDAANVTGLKLRVTGRDLSRVPSDDHQTVTKSGEGWIIDVHPPKISAAKPVLISEAGSEKPAWLRPSLDIPSDSKSFVDLAAKIVKGEKRVIPAAVAIKNYVTNVMHPNAGIGVLRDAGEVLSTKEGVCRDYAILTATLMRAAGVPARLASGVVNWQGDFYYHAWVEIWDGNSWIGVDSTVPDRQISAAHVKLADGNVEDAFAFTFLDKVKIDVLDVRRS